MPALSFSRLVYSYPSSSTRALDSVDLELDGGLTLLTGRSGSGKSTLLRVCNGLVPHFHGGVIGGRALVFGRDVLHSHTRELAREVGFVFQDPELQAVYPTTERDVAFGLENLGIPAAEMRRRVDQALEACGIAPLRQRAVSTLSGGERQRLALAGVLAMQPRLLVLDEPLSQLDPDGAAALLSALDGAARSGATVLVAEHHDTLTLPHADWVLAMDGGRLGELGSGCAEQSTSARPPAGAGQGWSPRGPVPPAGPGGWRLAGVTAGHAGVPVIHDLELACGGGEVVALIGPNGSGKTTLLRTIAGLLPPLSGSVERAPGRVAYLPQNPSVVLHRSNLRAEVAWTLRRSRSPEGRGRPADRPRAP